MKQLEYIEVDFDSSTDTATALTSYQIEYVSAFVNKIKEIFRPTVLIVKATKLVHYILAVKHACTLKLYSQEGGLLNTTDDSIQSTHSKSNKIYKAYMTVLRAFVNVMATMEVIVLDGIQKVDNLDINVDPQEAKQWCEEIERDFKKKCYVYNEETNMFITYRKEYREYLKIIHILLNRLGKAR